MAEGIVWKRERLNSAEWSKAWSGCCAKTIKIRGSEEGRRGDKKRVSATSGDWTKSMKQLQSIRDATFRQTPQSVTSISSIHIHSSIPGSYQAMPRGSLWIDFLCQTERRLIWYINSTLACMGSDNYLQSLWTLD